MEPVVLVNQTYPQFARTVLAKKDKNLIIPQEAKVQQYQEPNPQLSLFQWTHQIRKMLIQLPSVAANQL